MPSLISRDRVMSSLLQQRVGLLPQHAHIGLAVVLVMTSFGASVKLSVSIIGHLDPCRQI